MIKLLTSLMMLISSAALANGGELYLAPRFEVGLLQLSYQRAGVPAEASRTGGISYGFEFRYGLTNDVHLGLGIGWTPETASFDNVEIMGQSGRLFASYSSLSPGAQLSWLWRNPGAWNALFTLEGGPAFVSWEDSVLTEAGGSGFGLAFDLTSTSDVGGWVGLRAEAEWRPLDWLGVSFGPNVRMEQLGGTRNFYFMFAVRPFAVFGAGPSWAL